MRIAFIATLFIALIALSHAETLDIAKIRGVSKKTPANTLIENMRKSNFGNTLVNMLTLKLKTSDGALETLLALIEDLSDNIHDQQNEDDDEYQTSNANLQGLIDGLQADIAEAEENISDFEAQTAENQNALNQASVALAAATQEQDSLTAYRQTLVDIRTTDKDAYDNRVEGQQALIGGIAKTVTLFENQQSNQELNQEAVAQILDLLRSIQTSYENSISEDGIAEADAEATYATNVAAIDGRLTVLADTISELNGAIAQLQSVLEQLANRLASEEQRLDTSSQLLAQYQEQQQELTATYNSNKAVRLDQLKLSQLVEQKLNDEPNEVIDVLDDA